MEKLKAKLFDLTQQVKAIRESTQEKLKTLGEEYNKVYVELKKKEEAQKQGVPEEQKGQE